MEEIRKGGASTILLELLDRTLGTNYDNPLERYNIYSSDQNYRLVLNTGSSTEYLRRLQVFTLE